MTLRLDIAETGTVTCQAKRRGRYIGTCSCSCFCGASALHHQPFHISRLAEHLPYSGGGVPFSNGSTTGMASPRRNGSKVP